MASGQLKITLTGHINTVRGLEVSKKHAYLFSCGEDKTVRCWDLEYNKVLIFSYFSHIYLLYRLLETIMVILVVSIVSLFTPLLMF